MFKISAGKVGIPYSSERHSFQVACLIVLAGLAVVGFNIRARIFAGLAVWQWPFRDQPSPAPYWFLLFAIPLLYFGLGDVKRYRLPVSLYLAALASVVVAGNLYSCWVPAISPLAQAAAKIKDPGTTSYYTDAIALMEVKGWLARFPTLSLHLHSSTHPPGPILWYITLIRIFGPQQAASASAVLISLLAATSAFLIYAYAAVWTDSLETRLVIASILSLSPALLFIFPEFDQVYPLFTLLLVLAWHRAIQGSLRWALAFGFVWFAASLMAFHLLILAVFFATYAALGILQFDRSAVRRIVGTLLCGLTTFICLYFFLYFISGYNVIRTFIHAMTVQRVLDHSRPHTLATPWIDLYDFALGLGYVPLILFFFLLSAVRVRFRKREPDSALLTGAALITLAAVSTARWLDYETARVWLFFQPLVIAPAALALAQWGSRERLAVLISLAVVTATIGRQLWFL